MSARFYTGRACLARVGFAVQVFSSPNGGWAGNFNRFWAESAGRAAIGNRRESTKPRPAQFPAEIGPAPAQGPFRADFVKLVAISGPSGCFRSAVAFAVRIWHRSAVAGDV